MHDQYLSIILVANIVALTCYVITVRIFTS